MCIVLVCMRYVKKFGCHYNQSGVLKIEILILLRLARFQNLGTPPRVDATEPQSWSKSQKRLFLVIFAIFDGFERGRTSASFITLTSNLAYYTSYTYGKYN